MNIKRDTELLFEIGCFRFIPRSWRRFLIPEVANNAEHTFRVIWIALILAEYKKAKNKDKILKMALIHDLTESRCGDVDYISRQYTERKEKEAIEDILKDTIIDKEMIEVWKEYEKRESVEAKIVKDADNLDVQFELRELEIKGNQIKDVWKKNRRQMVYPRLYTKSAKKIWDEMEKTNPHDWHLKGKNRYNSGDWKMNGPSKI